MFAIAPYLVEVKDDRQQAVDLWNFNAGNNLHAVLKDYFNGISKTYIQAPGNRMLIASKICKGSSESIAVVYKTGEFGYESDIYNTSKQIIAHQRKKDEADMIPFNFAAYFPKKVPDPQKKRGIMLLGRWKTHGIRTLAIPHLATYFSKRFPGFSLHVNRALPKSVLETLMKEGTLKKIRLVKRQIPTDIADIFSVKDRSKIGDIELVIRSRRNSVFSDINWLANLANGISNPTQIVTIDSFPGTEKVKLEIEIGNRLRTIDLGNLGKLSSNIDINDVALDPSGHPNLTSWLAEADLLAKSIGETWGMTNLSWSTAT